VPVVTSQPRQVLVISLGGTITMTAGADGGVTPALTAADLLSAVPGLADLDVEVRTEDFRRLPGASLSFDDLRALQAFVQERFASGIHGVVVVQGTDTIEETSYLLDLYHDGPQPIIVTGAMRGPTMAGADGPANLLASVQAAASSVTRELGCLVVFADEIHAARRVRKTHSAAGSTFQSPTGGSLGYLVEGQPRIVSRTTAHTSHLLSAEVQFLTEMLVVEIADPVMRRDRDPALYDVPLLRFGSDKYGGLPGR